MLIQLSFFQQRHGGTQGPATHPQREPRERRRLGGQGHRKGLQETPICSLPFLFHSSSQPIPTNFFDKPVLAWNGKSDHMLESYKHATPRPKIYYSCWNMQPQARKCERQPEQQDRQQTQNSQKIMKTTQKQQKICKSAMRGVQKV